MTIDLNGITVFLAVAEARSFRKAAEALGITRPAVSQSLRRLENRLGVALFHRTTRSVSLTEAGDRLYQRVAPAIADVGHALESSSGSGAGPRGRLRLAVSSIAERFVSGPLLRGFLDTCPDVVVDVTVTDEELDIVAEGYDAGVRLGEAIEQDMIAIPVSSEQRQVVVGAPSYLQRYGTPAHPRELAKHRCIGWRPRPEVVPYRWEFGENGVEFTMDVSPQVTTNDMSLMLRTACAGGGLTFGMTDTFGPYLERGELVGMLQDFCPPFPGFYFYYPSRSNQAAKLRAMIDYLRSHPA